MTNQELKSAYLHNARTFMAQAFDKYEKAENYRNTIMWNMTSYNWLLGQADDCARDAEAQFKMAGYYS
jgi:hypothetical protein